MALPGGRPSQSTCNRITESERQLWCEYHLNNSIQQSADTMLRPPQCLKHIQPSCSIMERYALQINRLLLPLNVSFSQTRTTTSLSHFASRTTATCNEDISLYFQMSHQRQCPPGCQRHARLGHFSEWIKTARLLNPSLNTLNTALSKFRSCDAVALSRAPVSLTSTFVMS